ncbi:hypothetical protein PanWU01x14_214110 [Parasponia andersonii]|uniref:Uncharacterized protein n=1 Tax=Parasponia andersonii TaxID=3476 RepID=A0A2P5BSD8_PARAD|nr:hypothetical protein PanWU01x14_214110 [Parasponia andersonii]
MSDSIANSFGKKSISVEGAWIERLLLHDQLVSSIRKELAELWDSPCQTPDKGRQVEI